MKTKNYYDHKKVWIENGCIGARYCHKIVPRVFGLDKHGEAYITSLPDLVTNETGIKKAAKICPVRVIKFEE